MSIIQIQLSEAQQQALEALSQSRGQMQEEILHQAVEQFLEQHQTDNRLAASRAARGIWRDREDLPDFAELRDEWNS